MNFFKWFEDILPKLEKRAVSMKKIIDYLETLPSPIFILETGCLRKVNNFAGDGQSTLIFDNYIRYRGKDSKIFSVDINELNVRTCKNIVSEYAHVECSDSIKFISNFNKLIKDNKLSLLYLDSFDVNWDYPLESSAHHLKELTASIPYISDETLVVVDDAPLSMIGYRDEDDNFKLTRQTKIGGKGYLVHEYAVSVEAEIYFSHYQVGYKKLIKSN